jgi:hypothetical protein
MAIWRYLKWLPSVLVCASGWAAQTTGGVTFADTLGYLKPAFYPLTVPTEASATKYYIDMTSGSGSTCSQASPCAAICDVAGKAGTTGGPLYIYLKGNGRLTTGCTLYGSAGNEIVIKPWPSDSTPAVMTADGGGTVGAANRIEGANLHHWIMDGGPSMLFRFVGSGYTGGSHNGYTLIVNANNITLARVRCDSADTDGACLGVATGAGVHTSDFAWVNSELYGASRMYGVYTGGGSSCCVDDNNHTNIAFRNSVFRDIDGRGIQVEPRGDSSGVLITGNAFHNIGYASGGGGAYTISACVHADGACCGGTTNLTFSSNLAFDLGGGGVYITADSATNQVLNNTIYDYAKSEVVSGCDTLTCHGITSFGDGEALVVRNNMIVSSQGSGSINACNRLSGWTATNNLTYSPATACGSSQQTWTAAGATGTVLSVDPDSASFMVPSYASAARNTGYDVSASVIFGYRGEPLESNLGTAIGAIRYYVPAPTNFGRQ